MNYGEDVPLRINAGRGVAKLHTSEEQTLVALVAFVASDEGRWRSSRSMED
jgi:hypothetical protein